VKRWVGALSSDGKLIPTPEKNSAAYLYYERWNLIEEEPSFGAEKRSVCESRQMRFGPQ